MSKSNGADIVRIIGKNIGHLIDSNPTIGAATPRELVLAIIAVAQEAATVSGVDFVSSSVSFLPCAGISEEAAIDLVRRVYVADREVRLEAAARN